MNTELLYKTGYLLFAIFISVLVFYKFNNGFRKEDWIRIPVLAFVIFLVIYYSTSFIRKTKYKENFANTVNSNATDVSGLTDRENENQDSTENQDEADNENMDYEYMSQEDIDQEIPEDYDRYFLQDSNGNQNVSAEQDTTQYQDEVPYSERDNDQNQDIEKSQIQRSFSIRKNDRDLRQHKSGMGRGMRAQTSQQMERGMGRGMRAQTSQPMERGMGGDTEQKNNLMETSSKENRDFPGYNQIGENKIIDVNLLIPVRYLESDKNKVIKLIDENKADIIYKITAQDKTKTKTAYNVFKKKNDVKIYPNDFKELQNFEKTILGKTGTLLIFEKIGNSQPIQVSMSQPMSNIVDNKDMYPSADSYPKDNDPLLPRSADLTRRGTGLSPLRRNINLSPGTSLNLGTDINLSPSGVMIDEDTTPMEEDRTNLPNESTRPVKNIIEAPDKFTRNKMTAGDYSKYPMPQNKKYRDRKLSQALRTGRTGNAFRTEDGQDLVNKNEDSTSPININVSYNNSNPSDVNKVGMDKDVLLAKFAEFLKSSGGTDLNKYTMSSCLEKGESVPDKKSNGLENDKLSPVNNVTKNAALSNLNQNYYPAYLQNPLNKEQPGTQIKSIFDSNKKTQQKLENEIKENSEEDRSALIKKDDNNWMKSNYEVTMLKNILNQQNDPAPVILESPWSQWAPSK